MRVFGHRLTEHRQHGSTQQLKVIHGPIATYNISIGMTGRYVGHRERGHRAAVVGDG